uniref:Reverse transcriptase domain-containing protein n=1 Tax=Tanacetum cinerariifolium TaxID=118510 RepID=A0A699I358_TANCI|nr:hypothetical protein [Tanacetum cinerariifolium]
MNNFQSVQEEEICDSGQSVATKGGSVLGVLEEVIRVGQTMGYSMEGCEKDIESIIRNQGDDVVFRWRFFLLIFKVLVTRRKERNSGGILCIWEATVFKKEYVTISDNFVAIYETWLPNNSRILFVVVYAPQQVSSKRVLWDYMSVLLSRWNGEVIMMGDFNEVRSRDKRRGSWFNPSSARIFNQFISSSGLVDIKREGYTFTWSHPSATKMSKLDRFLVSDDFYHSWFSFDGFDDMVERTWRSFSHSDGNEIDKELDQGVVSDVNLRRRLDLNSQLHDINIKEATDSFQKSKVRWAIEGYENSKFFHGIINKKRSQLAIRGVFVDGCWCTDPILVKEAFHDHFKARFKKPIINRLKLNFPFNKRLLHDQAADLERRVSRDEIRMAVMDAKFVNDYRPISLIGSVYKVVTKILANRLAVVIADIVSDTQSAFIAERQILDGPFILNEVLHWCKRKNKKSMFFKVDFAKAYDSVRCDYLIDVLEAFGFGPTWCKWIRGTFCFAKASILVNGSPSNEFQFHHGLKQGDPLSPYLFILVMESLHLSFSRAVEEGLFKGICLNGPVSISHLFYANDAMFIREWSDANLRGIINILKCFFLASGLQININKSQVFIALIPKIPDANMVKDFRPISLIGSIYKIIAKILTNRLVGVLGDIINEVQSAFIEDRQILDGPFILNEVFSWCKRKKNKRYYLREKWRKWIQCCLNSSKGSIIINGSPTGEFQFGKGLKQGDPASGLKINLSKSKIMGIGVDAEKVSKAAIKLGSLILKTSFLYLGTYVGGNMNRIQSWDDIVNRFKSRPIQGGVEQQQRTDLALLMDYVSLSSSQDRWVCDLSGDGEFRVKEIRNYIDDMFLPVHPEPTRWTVLRRVCRWEVSVERRLLCCLVIHMVVAE